MEVIQLDVNTWSILDECCDVKYIPQGSYKITYDWFNKFGISELTNLTVITPCMNLSEIVFCAGGGINYYSQNDFAFFTIWFLGEIVKIQRFGFRLDYGMKRNIIANGVLDLVREGNFKNEIGFKCSNKGFLSVTAFALRIKAERVLSDYWNKEVKEAMLKPAMKSWCSSVFKKLERISNPVQFAAELLKIKSTFKL